MLTLPCILGNRIRLYRSVGPTMALLAFASFVLPGCQMISTSANGAPTINAPSLQTKWVLKGGFSSWFQGVDTVAATGTYVYAIADSSDVDKGHEDEMYLRSLKVDTGKEVWHFNGFDGMPGTIPVQANGKVYFGMSEIGTGTYYLYCVDGASGHLNWRVRRGLPKYLVHAYYLQ